MSDALNRYEAAVEPAKAKGCVVVLPKPNELFVDIDEEANLLLFDGMLRMLTEKDLHGATRVIRPSPSGRPGRYHVVVTLPFDVTDIERLFLQLLLGSDPVREMLSYFRLRNGDTRPTLFFEKASEARCAICDTVHSSSACP